MEPSDDALGIKPLLRALFRAAAFVGILLVFILMISALRACTVSVGLLVPDGGTGVDSRSEGL